MNDIIFHRPKVIVWVLLTNIYDSSHFIFRPSYSRFTRLFHYNGCRSSCKWQYAITFCFFCFIASPIRLRCYIFLITPSILSTLFPNTIYTGYVAITENQVSLYFVFYKKLCLWFNCFNFYFLNVIVWVLLTNIYMISHFIFQISD